MDEVNETENPPQTLIFRHCEAFRSICVFEEWNLLFFACLVHHDRSKLIILIFISNLQLFIILIMLHNRTKALEEK